MKKEDIQLRVTAWKDYYKAMRQLRDELKAHGVELMCGNSPSGGFNGHPDEYSFVRKVEEKFQ